MAQIQQYTNPITGAMIYVPMIEAVTFFTRRQPTTDELKEAADSLPPGNWVIEGPGDYGPTQILTANRDQWAVGVEWQNGKARPVLLTKPAIPSGYQLFVWASGQAALGGFDPAYGYYPGDTERFYLAIATGNQVYFAPFNIKTAVNIYFGNPS